MTNQTKKLSGGVVHSVPHDWRETLLATPTALALWEDITPLARNEWICWILDAKQEKTRKRRIEVGLSKLSSGMRRPCCWTGCTHRKDKTMSPLMSPGYAKKQRNKNT